MTKKSLCGVITGIALVLTGCGHNTGEARSVAALLGDPVHDETAVIVGVADAVGELFCPCFELSSGGGTVMVWYDLATHDGETIPAVDIAAISNGDTVEVTGWLVQKPTPAAASREFLATSIVKIREGSIAELPNPAAVYCEESGGVVEIRTDDLGQRGFCVFPDGSECDQWSYFHGRCQPGESTAGAPS